MSSVVLMNIDKWRIFLLFVSAIFIFMYMHFRVSNAKLVMTAFEELGVIPQLGEVVSELGWEFPTPIQCEAVPAILGGGDVLIAAETGSGKTGAFSLPLTQIVWEIRRDELEPKKKHDVKPSWRLNIADRDAGLAISANGLSCESLVPKAWYGARCMGGVHTKGKYYYEAKISRDGLCRVGWSTQRGTLNLGTDNQGFGFGGTGKKSYQKQFEDYGASFTTGDILGCYLDLDNLAIWWSKNGIEFSRAYDIAKQFATPHGALHPAVLVQCSSLELNFGDTPFNYPPGKGFIGVAQASEACVNWCISNVSLLTKEDKTAPLCVVLEPTRELVEQTHNNLVFFSKNINKPTIRCLSMASGVQMSQVLKELSQGADIVTGTASRIVDLVESKQLSLGALQFIVIDEADQFLADKSSRLIERLFSYMPLVSNKGARLQVIVCSATLHNFEIKKFADRFMHFPQWIDLKGMDTVAETVHQVVCRVDAVSDKQWIRYMHTPNHLEDDGVHQNDHICLGTNEKDTLSLGTKVLKGLYVLKAIKALKMEQCIIFCRTKQQCDQMRTYLDKNGLITVCLHGDRAPKERSQSLMDFKEKKIPFLICTDVAARGIDVHGVPFVINVTLPDEQSLYLHRIGRVGRAERMGLTISLVSKHLEKVWYHSNCRTRGVNCSNTKDLSEGGCSMWYNESKLLADIEEYIGQTIATVDSEFNIPVDEFDGKIVYGAKRTSGDAVEGHASQLSTSVAQLADLERSLQSSYLAFVSNTYKSMTVL